MGKRFHVIDVEASSRDYEKTVKEYGALLKDDAAEPKLSKAFPDAVGCERVKSSMENHRT